MAMRTATLLFLIVVLLLPTSACDKGLAYGDPNAVIIVAQEEWWPSLEDSVFAVLSPDVFTLHTERTFRLTYQPPLGVEWQRLQKFKEEVLIGSPEDPFIAEALTTLPDTLEYEVPARTHEAGAAAVPARAQQLRVRVDQRAISPRTDEDGRMVADRQPPPETETAREFVLGSEAVGIEACEPQRQRQVRP